MKISSIVFVFLFKRQYIRKLHQFVPFDEHQILKQSLLLDLNIFWLCLIYHTIKMPVKTLSPWRDHYLIRPCSNSSAGSFCLLLFLRLSSFSTLISEWHVYFPEHINGFNKITVSSSSLHNICLLWVTSYLCYLFCVCFKV